MEDRAVESKLTDAEWQEVAEIRDGLLKSLTRLDPDEVSDFSRWYAGITNNVTRRFVEHRLTEEKADLYDYVATSTQEVAEEVEKIFVDLYGMTGRTRGAEGDANLVYIYKKAPHTVP